MLRRDRARGARTRPRARIRLPSWRHAIDAGLREQERGVAVRCRRASPPSRRASTTRSQSPSLVPHSSRRYVNAASLLGIELERLLEEAARRARRSGGATPSACRSGTRRRRAGRRPASAVEDRALRLDDRVGALRLGEQPLEERRGLLVRSDRRRRPAPSMPSTSSGAKRRAMRAARRKSARLRGAAWSPSLRRARGARRRAPATSSLSTCTSSRHARASSFLPPRDAERARVRRRRLARSRRGRRARRRARASSALARRPVLRALQLQLEELLHHVELAEVPVDRRAPPRAPRSSAGFSLYASWKCFSALHAVEELRLEDAAEPQVIARPSPRSAPPRRCPSRAPRRAPASREPFSS